MFLLYLQLTVWGDYGRMERKIFMGVAQILLDDLDLSNIVIGWYKLFTSSSLVGHQGGGGPLSRRGSSSSIDGTESFATTMSPTTSPTPSTATLMPSAGASPRTSSGAIGETITQPANTIRGNNHVAATSKS